MEPKVLQETNDTEQTQEVPGLPDIKVRPTRDKTVTEGRAVVIAAWMWNGTYTTLPLAWQPGGKQHDNARHYLLKKHCLCCGGSGFRSQCPDCRKVGCTACDNGKAKLIPCFYRKKEDVPFPARFYGNIPCFLQFCPRQGERGFQTQEDMRIHARSRHRMEYQAHLDTIAANKQDELAYLREQVQALLLAQKPTFTDARATAPLYIKEPKEPKK